MVKKVLISLEELLQILHSGHTIPSLTKWFEEKRERQYGKIVINVDGEPLVWGAR